MVDVNITRTYTPVSFLKTEAAHYAFAPVMIYTGLTSGLIPFVPVNGYQVT